MVHIRSVPATLSPVGHPFLGFLEAALLVIAAGDHFRDLGGSLAIVEADEGEVGTRCMGNSLFKYLCVTRPNTEKTHQDLPSTLE